MIWIIESISEVHLKRFESPDIEVITKSGVADGSGHSAFQPCRIRRPSRQQTAEGNLKAKGHSEGDFKNADKSNIDEELIS